MRTAFSDMLVSLAKMDPKVLLLTGDHGYALFDSFRHECPRQYINAGIAEQNMVGVAAGLAKAGFKPFVYGLSAFIPVRVLEQIKIDIAYDDLPVVLVGDGAGLVYSRLGVSHQSAEDIACTRAIPNLAVYSPADRFEMAMCMRAAYAAEHPVYLRMGKADRGDVHKGAIADPFGSRLLRIKEGEEGAPAIVATGSMVVAALHVARAHFQNFAVWSAPIIKPIPAEQLHALCRESQFVVTIEEHSVIGGLGSMVAEAACDAAPVRILRIGVDDFFMKNCGTYEYLIQACGLDEQSVRERIEVFMSEA